MELKMIGLKDFRQNMTEYLKKAKKGKFSYLVLKKNEPVMEVKILDPKEYKLKKLKKEIAESRAQYERGEYYTLEEVKEHLGLN